MSLDLKNKDREKDYFAHLLTATGGDIKSMCRICGLSRAMVYARLKKYNLSRTS
jgi:transcriptional regulator of acetoin/glycerol metabolism